MTPRRTPPRSAARSAASARALLGLGVAGALAAGCKPNLDETVSIVTGPTVLAVRVDPPEVNPLASPPASVKFTALLVTTTGDIASAPIEWDFCNAREPLAELGPVNNQCLAASGPQFVPIGSGLEATGTLPVAACSNFGPDVPMVMAGQTQGRPVDPDSTGGYYQPARFLAPGTSGAIAGIAETRIACGVSNATPDQVVQFGQQYHLNANPTVRSMSIVTGGTPGAPLATADTGQTNQVAAGQHLTLEVAWPSCPLMDSCGDGICGPDETTATPMPDLDTSCAANTVTQCAADCQKPAGCGGAERYLDYDLATQCLVDARESMAVAWFATGGSFDNDRTGREGTDTTTTSDNGWQAPAQAGSVTLWVVLRDARGGTGWAEYTLGVQ